MSNRLQRRQAELMEKIQKRQKYVEENKYWSNKIKQAEEEIKEEVTHYYIGLMYTVFIIVMRRAFGFGKKRLYKAVSELAAILNDLEDGTIDVYDIKREAEAVGMTVVFDANRHFVKANIFEEVAEK